VSQSLIAFDTNHIKSYVFGTNKLKEIRGASSLLDKLNRNETVNEAKKFRNMIEVYAYGGSALFVVDSDKAEEIGKAVQRLYHEQTGGGASITYAIQHIPDYSVKNIMTDEDLGGNVMMSDVLKLLRLRLRMAKDSLSMDGTAQEVKQAYTEPTSIALPSHPLLSTCDSCGDAYAQDVWRDSEDPGDEGFYCRRCMGKREEDKDVKMMLRIRRKADLPNETLWGRIIRSLGNDYLPSDGSIPQRPQDFNDFRGFTHGKEYLGLIYADANGMGKAMEKQPSLQKLREFAEKIDDAVFATMGQAITTHLPLQGAKGKTFPFDVLLIGGDDIVLVTPADKAMQVAQTLGDSFHKTTGETLSIGAVLAPVKYPFALLYSLVDETLKAAKKSGAKLQKGTNSNSNDDKQDKTRVNFVVVTGNTSLGYQKQYSEMHREPEGGNKNEFYATLRPYALSDLNWLIEQLQQGNQKRLGRTKLHQLREAILKLDQTTSIVEALALLRNWRKDERDFMKDMVLHFDTRSTKRQKDMGPLFPWFLDGAENNESQSVYRTPLLDFIELYDFVLS